MKRLWDVFVLTLALNFLAMAGLVAWLYRSGRLDHDRVAKIRQIVFEPPPAPPATTQPTEGDATTRPSLSLESLLGQRANMTASQQVDFIRQTFDANMAKLERRSQELADLKSQIDLAQQKLTEDRTAVEADRKKLTEAQEQSRKLATDQGFQDSLNLYMSMPAKQAKAIFMTLGDDVIRQYMEAMPTRTAAKIAKEFKSPDENERIQRIMEKMRQAGSGDLSRAGSGEPGRAEPTTQAAAQ